jgi:hypothetical protein
MIENVIHSIRQWTGFSKEELSESETCQTSHSWFEKIADTDSFRNVCTSLLPELLNTVPRAFNTIGQSFSKESPSEQSAILSDIFQRIDFDKWAETVQTWILLSHSVEKENNQFLAQNFLPAITSFLNKIDFSDLKDMLKQTSSDINTLSETLNSMLWKYPAKMVLLCSIIPLVGNTSCMVARNTLKHFNEVPPDILADILISIIKEFDIKFFAQVIDELAELARKLHTGAALIGEPGADALSQQIRVMFEKLTENVNAKNVFKAKMAIEHIKNSIWNAWFASISESEERLSQAINLWFDKKNQSIRQFSQLTSILDTISEKQLTETFGNQFHDLEMTEVAEIINQLLKLLLRLEQVTPDALHAALFQWMESLDTDSIETMNENLAQPLMNALAPIIQKIAPHLIHSFCDIIDTDEDLSSALKRFTEQYIEK